MKRLLILVYSAFFIILLTNFFYYRSLYNKQINYINSLLRQQVQIVGFSVDETNNMFLSDLTKISYSDDLALFFTDPEKKYRVEENLKLFFSKYEDFVSSIKLYDNNRNEYTLKRENDEWLSQTYKLHVQGSIVEMEGLVEANKKYEYYQPIFKDNATIGNVVVTVDYKKYFDAIFSEFNLKDYQWQWVVSDSGTILYDDNANKISYTQIDRIVAGLDKYSLESLVHRATIDGKSKEIISCFYSSQLLQRNIALVFSAPTDFFQKYIIRNSVFIVTGTLLLIQLIIMIFWRYLKSQKSETRRLSESEKMLFTLIEEMPVGVIIHNKNREIIKANKVAASQYSYTGEAEMKGKIFPETSVPEVSEYFSMNLGGAFNPDQFVIIKKEVGEVILYRNSIPVVFMGEEATMEILIDVTMLESARKQEAKANVAKSEFLARMSYEIRTPLNGIIGMTDVLSRQDISKNVREIVSLLRRSTEVLLNIINDILDFSKIETGKMILDEIPFDLRKEIGYCIELARTSAEGDNISFSFWVDDKIPESIIADPFRLRQILTNLINHSAYNTSVGEIRLTCKLKSNNSGIIMLAFELLDTGKAFDKASLKKIFGDFVNIESKTVKTGDESGFGTILARQMIEMMGGELAAQSPSGISGDLGTKIVFTIKAYSNIRVVKDLNQDRIRSFSGIKTLIITGTQTRDEEILSNLHRIGLDISVTTFQRSTVNQIRGNISSPAGGYNLVIITDDEDFNGFEVARAIWENKLSHRIFLLMISSNDQVGNYMKCITLGIDSYLVKPFDNSELVNAITGIFTNIEQPEQADLTDLKRDVNILIVEDNKMNLKVIGTMLSSLGYNYDTAEDGYEGYMQAKAKKYDLIFMDLIMPEMDGYDSARRILAFDKSVLIVAFTADNMPDARRKAELSGIREIVYKPVRIEELKKLFAKYFRNDHKD